VPLKWLRGSKKCDHDLRITDKASRSIQRQRADKKTAGLS
jgi:hypothetical protein